MRHVRPLVATASLIGAIAAVPVVASAQPHSGPTSGPTIASVQQTLRTLAQRNDAAVEKYNEARVAVANRTQAAVRAQAGAQRARAQYDFDRRAFVQVVQANYQDQSFGAAGALLSSDSGSNYLDRLSTLNVVTTQTAQIVTDVTRARKSAVTAAGTAQKLLQQAQATRATAAANKIAVQKQIAKYQALLASLTAAQKAALARAAALKQAVANRQAAQVVASQRATSQSTTSQSTTRDTQSSRSSSDSRSSSTTSSDSTAAIASGAPSSKARIAVAFALAQRGKPYVWGSAGPSSFDCSGLTMRSWGAAGVSLPHSAREQYGFGTHVSQNDLEPGDLIFFYNPIGHVTIYIGGGLMVSAPTEGMPVQVVKLSEFQSDYAGATRLS